MRVLILVLLFPLSALGQSVSVAPYSFSAWGHVKHMGAISVEYEDVSLHYFHAYKPMECCYDTKIDNYILDTETQSTVGVSYSVDVIDDILKTGPLLTAHKFPLKKGTHLNFIFDLGYSFDWFRISYRHISNGFGLQGNNNVGLDQILISIPI